MEKLQDDGNIGILVVLIRRNDDMLRPIERAICVERLYIRL